MQTINLLTKPLLSWKEAFIGNVWVSYAKVKEGRSLNHNDINPKIN